MVVLLASESRAAAHAGGIAVAYPDAPIGVIVVDDSFTFGWSDADLSSGTSTPTVDWFYTDTLPPTFALGTIPPELEGTPIATGIPEHDLTNELVWNTSTVAPGVYWLWSIVNEEADTATAQVIGISPGVVVVAHPGDDVRPAVVITEPGASLFAVADQRYTVRYAALDPDGSGRITLEAYLDGSTDVITVAADLLAGDGSYEWDTSALTNGPWVIRAKIEDARGYEFTAYARYFLTVSHPKPPVIEDEGCSCRSGRSSPTFDWTFAVLILIALAVGVRRAV